MEKEPDELDEDMYTTLETMRDVSRRCLAYKNQKQMPMNEYISILHDLVNVSFSSPKLKILKASLEKYIGMQKYLRDTYMATTREQGLEVISQGKVQPSIIELWIEEELFAADSLDYDALYTGYPQYRSWLQEIKESYQARLHEYT